MASVYILYSLTANKYYVGCTKNLLQRFEYHLKKEFRDSFTAKYNDWELYFKIEDLSINSARKIEGHIKKMKSRTYIENLKKHPDIVKRLIEKYRSGALPR